MGEPRDPKTRGCEGGDTPVLFAAPAPNKEEEIEQKKLFFMMQATNRKHQ
jgi:hypothetical protein